MEYELTAFHTGAKNEANGFIFKELLQTPNFRITVVEESDTVELCGALKVGRQMSSRC